MTRLQDIAIGGGIVVCLLALVACAVQMVLEVMAVEASRRKDAGGGERRRTTPPPVPDRVAPPPGVDPLRLDGVWISATPEMVAEANERRAEFLADMDAAARVVADLEGRR